MLDNLRDQASSSPFFQDDQLEIPELEPKRAPVRRRSTRVLGMTPIQRLIMSIMIFMVVCLLGGMFLIVAEKIHLF